jgi:putative NADH-flavin reductase
MQIAVIGATGHTGRCVVEQALSRGHSVTALARRAGQSDARRPGLTTAAVDVLDPVLLERSLIGADAVVSALGIGTSRQPTITYSEGITNVLHAMTAGRIDKLSVISAAPVGPREEQPFLERRIAMPILDKIFGSTYEDMRRMEQTLRKSDVDWVSLRPPRLTGKPATGRYRISADGPLSKARSLTYADLASALLDALDRKGLYRRAAYVAN